jgi:hypothetical protein
MRTDFFAKFMTTGRSESPKAISSGQQLWEEIILISEGNFAKELGNSDRLENWRNVKFFSPARRELLAAWKRFGEILKLDSLFGIHAGVQQTLEPIKAFTLVMLRLCNRTEETLRNQAAVIYGAAREGDVEFFKNICLALRSRSLAKPEGSSLSYDILRYWFAGLLWLMNEEAGSNALRAYTNKKFTKDAYRKACDRLGLKGYKHRMRAPPVLAYHPRTRSYQYAPKWTRMGPNLSR